MCTKQDVINVLKLYLNVNIKKTKNKELSVYDNKCLLVFQEKVNIFYVYNYI